MDSLLGAVFLIGIIHFMLKAIREYDNQLEEKDYNVNEQVTE